MSSRRNLLSANCNGGGEKIENIIVLDYYSSERDYIDGEFVGMVYYYFALPTFPIQSDITIKDANDSDDSRFTNILDVAHPNGNPAMFSQKLTSPDDVIISPQEDNTYIYKVEIQN